MAAITLTDSTQSRRLILRNATAQANTGQTDWFLVPQDAQFAIVDFNLTAVAGTTPLVTTIEIKGADQFNTDDSFSYKLAEHADLATVDITAAAHLVTELGPGLSGIADEVTQAATGFSRAAINCLLPDVMGVRLLFDRTTGDETYTYTLAVTFRG